jgi:hypothetical protein
MTGFGMIRLRDAPVSETYGLGVVLGGLTHCHRRSARGRRCLGGEVAVFGVPFWAWAAHIMPLGPVGAGAGALTETLLQLVDRFCQFAPHDPLPGRFNRPFLGCLHPYVSRPPRKGSRKNASFNFKRSFDTSVALKSLKFGAI